MNFEPLFAGRKTKIYPQDARIEEIESRLNHVIVLLERLSMRLYKHEMKNWDE